MFLAYLPAKGKILDAGCGSGRDSLILKAKETGDIFIISQKKKHKKYSHKQDSKWRKCG